MVTEDELEQYGAMGTIIHRMAEMALRKDDNPSALWDDCIEEWHMVQSGSLKLNPSDANPRGFIEKYQDDFNWVVEDKDIEMTLWDDELMVEGTLDLLTTYQGKLAICDWKTSRSYGTDKKEGYWKQLACYAMMTEKKLGVKIEALVIMPLNPKNKCGYGKPLVEENIEHYKELFLKDLKEFNKLYR